MFCTRMLKKLMSLDEEGIEVLISFRAKLSTKETTNWDKGTTKSPVFLFVCHCPGYERNGKLGQRSTKSPTFFVCHCPN